MIGQSAGLRRKNTTVFFFTEIARSLVFTIPIWVAYERQYLTLSQFTNIEAIIIASQLLLELPTGAFADLLGKRISVMIGFFASAISMIVYLYARDYSAFIIYAVMNGLSDSFISGANEALLYDSLKQDHKEDQFTKYTSKYSLVFQLGIASATVFGGVLGSIAFQWSIIAKTIAFFVGGILCFLFKEPVIDTEKFTFIRYVRQTRSGVAELFKNNDIRLISLFYILVGALTWVCQLTFNAMLLTEVGHTALEIGIIFATFRILNSLVLFRLFHINTLISKSKVFLLFPVIMMISYLPGVMMARWVVIPFIAGAMFASTARVTVLTKYTNEGFDSKNRATAISALSMFINILYIAILVIAGNIMGNIGSVKPIYTMLGIFCLVFVSPLGIALSKRYAAEPAK